MNKPKIVARVAARAGLDSFTAERAVDLVFEAIAEGLAKEEDVRIVGFGAFRTRNRATRMGRNPRTGESVPIPASKSPSFKAAKALGKAVKLGWPPEAGELARKIAVGFAAPVRGGRGAVHCKGIGKGAPALTRCDRSGMLVI